MPETSHAAPSESNDTVSATEGGGPPQCQAAALSVTQGSHPSHPTVDTKAKGKTESEIKVEASVKAEAEFQPGIVKAEAKLEGEDDAPSNLLKEEEGVKGELKDDLPPATVRP